MSPSSVSLLAIAAVVGAAATGWVGRLEEAVPGEPIALRASDVTMVDGDTVRVADVLSAERIRLMGYDTPEVFDPDCLQEEELGRFASASLEDMLRGGDDRTDPGGGAGRLRPRTGPDDGRWPGRGLPAHDAGPRAAP